MKRLVRRRCSRDHAMSAPFSYTAHSNPSFLVSETDAWQRRCRRGHAQPDSNNGVSITSRGGDVKQSGAD